MYEELIHESWSPIVEWTEPVPIMQVAVSPAMRLARELADLIGACGFSVVLATDDESLPLTSVLDSTHAGRSLRSRALCASSSFTCMIAAAASPLWWRAPNDAGFLEAVADNWAREIANPLGQTLAAESSGIAFPVAQEHGGSGAVVFTGSNLALDEQTLCFVHARCHTLFDKVVHQHAHSGSGLPVMSKREIECLRLTANGCTSDDIATSLGLSVHTANQYLTSAAQKLNAVNRIHAVAKALRAGLID